MKTLLITIVIFLIIHNADFPQDEKVILSLSGSGIRNSEPFTVSKPWKIEWFNGAKDMIFSINLISLDGELIEILTSIAEYGTGSTYCYKSGEFYLSIQGMGNWKIKITEENNSKKSTNTNYNLPDLGYKIPEKRVFNHPPFSDKRGDDFYFNQTYNSVNDLYTNTILLKVKPELFMGALYLYKETGEKVSTEVVLLLVSDSEDRKYFYNSDLTLLINNERIEIGKMNNNEGSFESEYLSKNIPTELFLKIINASSVEGKLDLTLFKLSEEQLEAFRDFASRMKNTNFRQNDNAIPEKRVFNHPPFSNKQWSDYFFENTYDKDDNVYSNKILLKIKPEFFIGALYLYKDRKKISPDMAILLISGSQDRKYLNNSNLIFLVDNEKIEIGEMEGYSDVGNGYVAEYLTKVIPTELFLKIINAFRVEGKLYTTTFNLSEEQLEAFRDFASRMK